MENGKKIDAACIGYAEEMLPCERELRDLGEYSACTVVAHSLGVNDDGELLGTMLISFGPMYHKERKISYSEIKQLADVINDVVASRAEDGDGEESSACDDCEFKEECAEYPDLDPDDAERLKKEIDELVSETEALVKALKKLK